MAKWTKYTSLLKVVQLPLAGLVVTNIINKASVVRFNYSELLIKGVPDSIGRRGLDTLELREDWCTDNWTTRCMACMRTCDLPVPGLPQITLYLAQSESTAAPCVKIVPGIAFVWPDN